MAALVQTFPQQTGTVTMIQTRPASANDMLPAQSQSAYAVGQQPRSNFYGMPNNMGSAPVLYRSSTAPIQPYAFTSTPSLHATNGWQPQQQQQQYGQQHNSIRPAASTPALPRMQSFDVPANVNRNNRMPFNSSMANLPNGNPSAARYVGSRDDSSLPNGQGVGVRRVSATPRPQSAFLPGTAPTPQLSFTPAAPLHRHLVNEDAKRFRRRSMPTLNGAEFLTASVAQRPIRKAEEAQQLAARNTNIEKQATLQKPVVMHAKAGSSESVVSTRSNVSRPSSTSRNATVSGSTTSPLSVAAKSEQATDKTEEPLRLVNIPPRVSSSDTGLSTPKPSAAQSSDVGSLTPSGSTTSVTDSTTTPKPAVAPSHLESPAMRHLTAINQKGGKLRSKTSKLRRAFSFGSAAELRKATEEEAAAGAMPPPSKLQKGPTSQEAYDAEQDRIAQQQEEGGIGSSIYAGARIFSGSTDNLSISSTASSASIMIRKMGRGMKKSTRSLVGLFRPKSIIGVPGTDANRPETSGGSTPTISAAEATVSMVTVEAERERVNVHPDVHAQAAGGTNFPRLERNSVDASRDLGSERIGSSGAENPAQRMTVGEGDRERAEVLAAVRKGILKNTSGSSSPVRSPADIRTPPFELHNPPAISESPASSAPSTPNDEMQGHKRSGSVAIGGEDYFVSALRLRQDSKSGSSTPQGSMKRNATFSPRIIFHDTWPSQEYDRRGEIATCNRLTPMLAQQIKEELNSFKMEMEVHETSKIYTHFF
ncbi:dihydroflavonal-4-reductase protein [Ophiostoma piceae UAMH 11346]|uniref:Dihydroflavonal-4-reductase protein n=1 Tax=Ophiostoma piceae (strain UAMH 11346) TaxID=1262450 RepID=S3CU85_OPHP1|nr:dihydroflavonal-4-reductase protein [Ophiostoma piceae UAMH 11346]